MVGEANAKGFARGNGFSGEDQSHSGLAADARREIGSSDGREDAQVVTHERDDVRLVQRAVDADDVAEVARRDLAEAREPVCGLGDLPAARHGRPDRRREMVIAHDRHDVVLVAGVDHSPIVIERVVRELTLGRLDPRPLEREAIRAEAEVGQ